MEEEEKDLESDELEDKDLESDESEDKPDVGESDNSDDEEEK